jgi:hypothetical protein
MNVFFHLILYQNLKRAKSNVKKKFYPNRNNRLSIGFFRQTHSDKTIQRTAIPKPFVGNTLDGVGIRKKFSSKTKRITRSKHGFSLDGKSMVRENSSRFQVQRSPIEKLAALLMFQKLKWKDKKYLCNFRVNDRFMRRCSYYQT